jgi:hypothetical protein
MFKANVEYFHKEQHVNTSIDSLTKGQKAIFCSLIRHSEMTTFEYMRDLLRWQKELDKHGVVLYLLTTQPIQVANIQANTGLEELKEAKIILDRNHKFYTELKKYANKSQEARWLGRYWLFHALIEDGNMLHLQAQPTEDRKNWALKHIKPSQFQDLIKYKKKPTLDRFLKLPEDLIYEQQCLFEFDDEHDKTIYQIMYYQNLWPNTNVIKYLESVK